MMDDKSEWVNGKDAGKMLGISRPILRQLISDQDILHLRLGVRWKIKPATLAEHLDRIAQAQVGQ